MSARFASLVIQNTNMAMIFLGKAPNPQTSQTSVELDHARYFIDQLEMIEAKTKGNLDKNEENLLRQSLTALRLAFVEAADDSEKKSGAPASPPAPATDEQETPINEPVLPGEKDAPAPPDSTSVPDAESRKKFSKKY